jgi:hypothetical protein
MSEEKISLTYDDLNHKKVERRLKEQEAISRTRKYSQMEATELPKPAPDSRRTSILYNPIVSIALFGLLGGILAWGAGEILRLRPDPRIRAKELIGAVLQYERQANSGQISQQLKDSAVAVVEREGQDNPYFALYVNPNMTQEQKTAAWAELDKNDELRDFITNVVSYGVCGLMIALCLSIAEPIVDNNRTALVINGSVGAFLGLLGGVAAALVIDRLYHTVLTTAIGAGPAAASTAASTGPTLLQQMIARGVTYGALGSLLTLGPGLVLLNPKRTIIGVFGGAIGGIVGGLLFDPVASVMQDTHFSRLIAYCAIGLVAGAATGVIEQAAKSGWVKVTEGLIAGKQFILYRNPTYVGSAPDCQIYLFKDTQVGRRHAAIHLVKGGFDIEDLPLGGKTLVNGKPITRTRLRGGDKIQIGATTFVFNQKAKTA